jgi:putative inorganic carbon (HCO3(-)) transporter
MRRRSTVANTIDNPVVSTLTFVIYILFVFETFTHLSARFSLIAMIRPTLIFVVVITILLIAQKDTLAIRPKSKIISAVNILMVYIVITLPLVEYAGSVIRTSLPEFIKAIVFFYFTAYIIDTRKRLIIFIKVFIVTQLFRVFEPLWLNLTTGYWGDATYKGDGEFANRLAGSPFDVVNPNGLGFIIVTLIPFLHYLVLPKGFKGKVLYFSLLIPLLYALILTMSRGSFLVLIIIGWVIFKESKNKILLSLMIIVLAIAGWSQLDNFQKDRYLSLIGSSTGSNSKTVEGRLDLTLKEFGLGLSRPIVGHGVGTTPEVKFNTYGTLQASHNMYGELLIEIGIIGFILFLRLIYVILKNLQLLKSTMINNNKNDSYTHIIQTLLVVTIMYCVYSLNYFGLSQYYWYLLGGMVVVVERLNKQIQNT